MSVIAKYTFPSTNAGQSGAGYQATTVDSNVTASDIDDSGANLTMTIGNNGYSTDPEISVKPSVTSTTASAAVTNNTYFEFTVTPKAGAKMSFTTLTFKDARGGAGTRGYVLRSSLDSYGSTISTADCTTQRPTWPTDISVDLSAGTYQNLSSAVTFRIYTYTGSTNSSIEYDDITLNGTTSGGGSGRNQMILIGDR